ncbi:MAG: RagB/SusD family nutrient uptake outer membrane protein [Bacteroides sp.]
MKTYRQNRLWIIIRHLAGWVGVLLLAGCDHLLSIEPPSSVLVKDFFYTEDELATFAISLYNFRSYGEDEYGVGPWADDDNTDNQVNNDYPLFWQPGEKMVGADAGGWDFSRIRQCNFFFEQVLPKYEKNQITGNAAHIRHYIGEVYVLRAYEYFNKLAAFGDFPIVTDVLLDNETQLRDAGVRRPRNLVARFILDDLEQAAQWLLEVAPDGRKNRISRPVALLLRSRVALFEATWERYHQGTPFVPGGKGWKGDRSEVASTDWAKEIDFFLSEAMKDAAEVADAYVDRLAVNTGTEEGMDASLTSINPYYTLFCDEDMSGYDEVLLWRQYVLGMMVHNCQMDMERNAAGRGWTRGLVNSFLMANGLPIYDPRSGYCEEWELQGVQATLQGRDSRLRIFNKEPGEVNFYTSAGQPVCSGMEALFLPTGKNTPTGFICKKGKHYSETMASCHHAGTSGYCVFRAAEALLNYMEASYELLHRIDSRADRYWRALRRRALVDEEYARTIAATRMDEERKWDFGACSHGRLVDATLYNIRRERRCELMGEPFRYNDLKRWRACDQWIDQPYVVQGIRYWGTVYERQLADKCHVDEHIGNMSSPDFGPYILPFEKITTNNTIHRQGGWLFTPAHYLEPIGMAVFRQTALDKSDFATSNIYQNPGWSIYANTPAEPVADE